MAILNSSTSSSEGSSQTQWRQFVRLLLASLFGMTIGCYGFILILDPYDSLSFSLPIDRVQVADQQRLFYPSLARNQQFDSAIIGNSNIRLLRPDILGQKLGGSWVNLAINAASSWEQQQIFSLFLQHHTAPKNVLLGMDYLWCYQRFADKRFVGATREQDFPAWLYDSSPYNNMPPLNLGSLTHSWLLMLNASGLKATEFGGDGYTVFTDPEAEYDLAKARREVYGSSRPKPIKPVIPPLRLSQQQRNEMPIPALARLKNMLSQLPPATRAILMFVPYHSYYQARPGSHQEALWNECKARVSAIAETRGNTYVLDFMLQTDLTREDSNYWDYKHYRVPVGDRISVTIGNAVSSQTEDDSYRMLAAPAKPPR